jgi:hypothetical protein
MTKKKLIRFIPFFILCIAILCGTTSCSSQKVIHAKKKAPGYKNVRNNNPKWNYTQNSKQTKYVIKHKSKKRRPY